MDEQNSTETLEVESGEREDAVDLQTENHDFDMVDAEGTEEETHETEDQEAKTVEENDDQDDAVDRQTREDNQKARLARLKAERAAKKAAQEQEAEVDRKIRESGAINPLTEKPFQNMKEFLEYGKAVREASGEAEEPSKPAETPKQDESNFFQDDLIDFMEKYPTVDVEKLDNNPKFRKFVGSRYGKEPLAKLYEDYRELVSDATKAAKADTRAARSTGTGNAGGDRLSASQRNALDAWNAANPDMKMTPNEFLNM